MIDPMTSYEQHEAEHMERVDEWAEGQHQTELEVHAKQLWTRTKVTAAGDVRTQPHRLEILARSLHKVSRYGAGEGMESEYQMDLLLTEWGAGRLMGYFAALAETEGK